MKVFILYFTRSYSQCALFILMYHRAWKIDLYIPIFFFLFLFWQWWYLPLLLLVKVISLVFFFSLLFQVIGYVWLLLHNIKQKLTSQTNKLDCEILWLNWTALEIWSKSNQGFVKGPSLLLSCLEYFRNDVIFFVSDICASIPWLCIKLLHEEYISS